MKTLRSLPLRFTLPLIVLLIFTALLSAVVYHQYRQLTALLTDAAVLESRHEMARLKRVMGSALARGDRAAAEREITGAAVDPRLLSLTLVDETGSVVFATRFSWKRQSAALVVPGFDAAIAVDVVRLREPRVVQPSDGGEDLFAYMPMALPAEESRPSRGVLFMHQSLASAYKPVRQAMAAEAGFLWLSGFIAMAILMFILHRFVAEPLRRLAEAAPLLTLGSETAELRVRGGAELAVLADAFMKAGRSVRSSLEGLRDREAKYRTIVDNAGLGIMLIDGDMKVVERNQVSRDWFPETGGHCSGQLAPGGIRFDLAEQSMRDGATREGFFGIECAGAPRQFRVVTSPVLNGDSGATACVEILEDITERLDSERQLGWVSRALRALSACNGAVVRAHDEASVLNEVCRVIVEQAGYTMAWIGVPIQDPEKSVRPVAHAGVHLDYLTAGRFSWDPQTPHGRGPTARAIRERRPVVVDTLNDPSFEPWRDIAIRSGFGSMLALPLLIDGEVFGVLAVYAEEQSAFGANELELLIELADTLAYGIGALRNRNALRQSEENLRSLNAGLETRIATRTEQLRRTNEELESFSYSVSHDLRAPLRSIDGFAQLLMKRYAEVLDGQGRDYLQRVCRATRRMGQLIDDLLSLSRINRSEVELVEVGLSELALRSLADLRAAEPERRVTVLVEPGIRACADPRLMQVVMDNLIGNAWKYTGRAVSAQIEFGAELTDNGPIYFVRDNGAGFNMAYADKLFEPFKRLHRMDEFEGSGIGLATVQRILSLHGGRIWAESEPGQGAIFRFCLPKSTAPLGLSA